MPTTPEEAIRRTMMLYAQLCDDGRFDEWVQLFTPDARFAVMGTTHTGHDAIRSFMENAQPSERRGRHAVFAPVVDLDLHGTTARAWTDYLFFDRSGAVTSTGRYHDELVGTFDGSWRFALREIVFQGAEPTVARPTPAR
jgi:3-phenylpropionate/cinnamic acid dioxygenase small subunit